ncbi:DegT/DnrJ/EryC1/StrS aminotransferase family protein [Candidatus Wolfebacteria bacterium]|nr:DegT/DnrJ/EryC1/StrS aminotransferase family protein [Candidatus Wolfebacteria bacterium]
MKKKNILVAEPEIGKDELNNVIKALKSGWISSRGEYIKKFEKNFAKYLGVKYAATTSSGTTGLHLALLALGIKKGDEVIIPDLTYIATANAVAYVGAKPVMVDVEPDYWCIDSQKIIKAITRKTKVIIPVHLYGNVAEMEKIMKIAKEYNLFVIEDVAEAHGAEYKGKKAGSLAHIGVFSFFGNKIITTGEGGMVVTNNKKIYERVNFLKNQGQSTKKRYWHPEIGFNYRMTNLQAAIGCAQLKKLNFFINKKRKIFQWYKKNLADLKNIKLNTQRKETKSVYWMVSLVLNKDSCKKNDRDNLIKILLKQGIETRTFFYLISEMPMYYKKNSNLNSVARKLSQNGLNLPSGSILKEKDIEVICEILKKNLL